MLVANKDQWKNWAQQAKQYNAWFTEESVENSLQGILEMLNINDLEKLFYRYNFHNANKKVGVIMAGNIPLVGFHDFMCILLSGNLVYAKVSSQDPFLIKKIAQMLEEINPVFKNKIFFVEKLNDVDAIIATGSDNSAKHFIHYFSHIPHIIRKNRSSIGILNGLESNEDFINLGKDIFTYYGLGCRNISKLYVPKGYSWNKFFEGIQIYEHIGNHHKYQNNYSYNKSVYLINSVIHLDNGFILLTENSNEIISPLGVIFFEEYNTIHDLDNQITKYQEKLQVVVSKQAWYPKSVPFGKAQFPNIDDFADNVDTLEFLAKI